VSLESVELWRPRRRGEGRGRARLVRAAAVVLLIAGLALGALLHRPVLLLGGLGGALALACFAGGGAGERAAGAAGAGSPSKRWSSRRPRRWVPRLAADRRGRTTPRVVPAGGRRRGDRRVRPGDGRTRAA
jgi:hypothetical protein